MPCTGGPSYPDTDKEELDKVTDLLCKICAVVDDARGPNIRDQVMVKLNEVDGLTSWWKHHKRLDVQRRAEESVAKVQRRRDLQQRIANMENELEDMS